MRIAKIINDSPAEVEGHFADIIYVQGCPRNCCYCFNPELKDFNRDIKHEKFYPYRMLNLSTLSDVVVITGGEPSGQYLNELIEHIKTILKKKLVIETSYFNMYQWMEADKILYCIKTFDIDEWTLKKVNDHDNVIPVVVVGHECFNMEGFKKAVKIIDKEIYIRYYNDSPKPVNEIYKVIKMLGKKYKVFKKICL